MNKNIKNASLAGVLFGIIIAIPYLFFYGLKSGVIAGIIAGLFFGITLGIFRAFMTKKFKKDRPSLENEQLIKEGPANHFKKIEGVGGWLYLTDKRFIFKSHAFNIQRHELIIPIQEIKEAKAVLTMGLIPNGLQIITVKGDSERFVVNSRKDWVNKITELKNM